MDNFSDKILEKIEKEKIKPEKKWKFLAKYTSFWITFIFVIFLSTIFLGIVFFFIEISEFDLYVIQSTHLFEYVNLILPIWFLVLLLILVVASVYFWRKAYAKGYKYTISKSFFVIFFICLILAGVFYSVGLSVFTHDILWHIPGFEYKRYIEYKISQLSVPEKGILVGKVLFVDSDSGLFSIKDTKKKLYNVVFTKNTKIDNVMNISPNNYLKIKGRILNENFFESQEIERINKQNLTKLLKNFE